MSIRQAAELVAKWLAPFITRMSTAFCIETSSRETFCSIQKANRS